MRRSDDFTKRCRQLPRGHWHCEHGHLIDCPATGAACPPVAEVETAHVIVCGTVAWVFPSEAGAMAQFRLLSNEGLVPRTHWDLTPSRVTALLRRLPRHVDVEDLR